MEIKKITDETKKAREFFQQKFSFMSSPFELNRKIKDFIEDVNIVDVRDYDDYIDGHIPYAIHVPFGDLENHLVMFEKDKLNIVYCESQYCSLAYKTAYVLADKGFKVKVLSGGIYIWKKLGFDVVKTSSEQSL